MKSDYWNQFCWNYDIFRHFTIFGSGFSRFQVGVRAPVDFCEMSQKMINISILFWIKHGRSRSFSVQGLCNSFFFLLSFSYVLICGGIKHNVKLPQRNQRYKKSRKLPQLSTQTVSSTNCRAIVWKSVWKHAQVKTFICTSLIAIADILLVKGSVQVKYVLTQG